MKDTTGMKDCPFYLKTVRFGYGRHGIYNQLSYSFPTDCKARTFDWRFDKRTQKLHDRKSRYMLARTMDLRASRSTWISRSKSEAKDSGE
ncbi:hypothetical protein Bca101_002662 [Brassica carinata]